MTGKKILAWVLVFAGYAMPAGLSAQETTGPKLIPKSAEGVDDTKGAGWHPGLRFSGNMALGQSKNVPGTTDGISVQLGYIINAGLDFLSQKKTNEWTNFLGMELAYTRTPIVDAFIKSIDKIDFKSTYLYHPEGLPWFGPFVAFRLTAPMLPGYEVSADPLNVVRLKAGDTQAFNDAGEPIDADGDVIDADHGSVTQVASGKKIDLTDAFAPLTLRESVGAFATPLEKPWLKTDFRLGFGVWQTFSRGGYVVEDNEDTADLFELRQMQDPIQLGPELGIVFNGAYKTHLTYFASALFMQPVYVDSKTEKNLENLGVDDGLDRMTMEFEAGLGVKITQYVSIDYSLKAYRQPLIINEWQVQNNILLTIAFEVPAPAAPPPVCPPAPECPADTAAQTETAPAPEAVTAPADTTASTPPEDAQPAAEAETAPPTDVPDAETTEPAAAETAPTETVPAESATPPPAE